MSITSSAGNCEVRHTLSSPTTTYRRPGDGAASSQWKHGNTSSSNTTRDQKITGLRRSQSASRPDSGATSRFTMPNTTPAQMPTCTGSPSSRAA